MNFYQSLKNSDVHLLLIIIAISFFIYGSAVFTYTPSIDGEFIDNFRHTVSLGRWGHALLHKYILPEPYSPFFTSVISILIFSLSVFTMSSTMSQDIKFKAIYSLLFLSVPQFAYQMQFLNQADTVSIGLLLCSLSGYLSTRIAYCESITTSLWLFISSIALLVLSFSIYQTFATLFYAIIVSYCIKEVILKRMSFLVLVKMAIVGSVILALSIPIYFAGHDLFTWIYDIPSRYENYAAAVTMWGKRDSTLIWISVLQYALSFFNGTGYYGLNIYFIVLVPIIFLTIYSLLRNGLMSCVIICMIAALAISPYILTAYFGSYQMPRTLFPMPLVFASLITAMLEVIGWRKFYIYLCIPLLMTSSMSVSNLFYSDNVSYQRDMVLTSKIYNDLYEAYPSFNPEKKRVFFYGPITQDNKWVRPNSDTFGVSFYSWDHGNNLRIQGIFSYYGILNLKLTQKSEIMKYEDEIKKMPTFPNKGYIKEMHDTIIIRLGENVGRR